MPTEKIAVTIDRELLARVERVRRRTHESRSALVSRALRELLDIRAREEQVTRYVEAYREMPESDAEVELADGLASEALSSVPWEQE